MLLSTIHGAAFHVVKKASLGRVSGERIPVELSMLTPLALEARHQPTTAAWVQVRMPRAPEKIAFAPWSAREDETGKSSQAWRSA